MTNFGFKNGLYLRFIHFISVNFLFIVRCIELYNKIAEKYLTFDRIFVINSCDYFVPWKCESTLYNGIYFKYLKLKLHFVCFISYLFKRTVVLLNRTIIIIFWKKRCFSVAKTRDIRFIILHNVAAANSNFSYYAVLQWLAFC